MVNKAPDSVVTSSEPTPAVSLGGLATASSVPSHKGWFSSWRPTLPSYLGPFPVGVYDVETPADPATGAKGVLVRLYYPTTIKDANTRSHAKWLPNGTFYSRGYGSFSKLPAAVSLGVFYPVLSPIKTPAFLNADLRPADEILPQKLPTVVFAHGLGGMRTTYSAWCGNLASQGMLVIATEFRDGSASVAAKDNYASSVPYLVPSEKNLPSDQSADEYLLNLRRGQVELKTGEIKEVVTLLRDLNAGKEVRNLMASKDKRVPAFASAIKGRVDFDNLVMAGHSFGAATALTALQEPDNPFKCGIALDPWMHAVSDLPVSKPFLSIQSHTFQWKKNLEPLEALFSHSSVAATSRFGVLLGTAHQDVSDFPALFPSLMRKIKLGGEQDPVRSLEIYHAWCMAFLKEEIGSSSSLPFGNYPGYEKEPSVPRPKSILEGPAAFEALHGSIRHDW
ncbi:Platelet-activating factor acetylhydrolase [Geranomyces variabilis]|uniref:Putative phospholipase n=1 Tax=Geranomyces variabilis TaxID=109894 RepID=A0AAD5TSC7_9FUNG|nr:Platelet-activating factor acetylhydrolase [Geranomyces variabilis]